MKNIYEVIIKPLLTEKTNLELTKNKYTFKVNRDVNKLDIKKAIEAIYKVKVKQVNTMNVEGKTVRLGRKAGRRSDWKKAIVTLQDGQKIEQLVS